MICRRDDLRRLVLDPAGTVVAVARTRLAGHGGLDAEILDQEAAIEYGRLNVGTLLTGPA